MSKPIRLDRFQAIAAPLIAVILTLVSFRAFFTSTVVGGTDAVWYGYQAADAVSQVRAGTFPTLVGNSEFNWTGSVHPYRTAPAHIYLIQLLDVVTLSKLSPILLQHLALLAAAAFGALSFYFTALKISEGRRWLSAGFAWLYATAPYWFLLAGFTEAYMSFTTLAVLPWFFNGLYTVSKTEGRRGLVTLGVSLVACWMCHPPIGLCTALFGLFPLVLLGAEWDEMPWRRIAIAAATSAGVGAFYFVSMSELPRYSEAGEKRAVLVIVLLFLSALTWLRFCGGRGRAWGIASLLVVLLLARLHLSWALWFAALAPCAYLFFKYTKSGRPGAGPLVRSLIPLFAATAIVSLLLSGVDQRELGGVNRKMPPSLSETWPNWVLPYDLSHPERLSQPGLALILFVLIAVPAFLKKRAEGRALMLCCAAVVLSLTYVPILSDFLVNNFPSPIAEISGFLLPIRYHAPLTTSLAAAGCFCAATALASNRGLLRKSAGLLVAVALVLNTLHVLRFNRLLKPQISAPSTTERNFLSENRDRKTFEYDLARVPEHYYAGVTHPALELRFRGANGEVLIGPDDIARKMEQANGRSFDLNYTPIVGVSETFFNVSPTLTSNPGELTLMRIDYALKAEGRNFLIWHGDKLYRETIFNTNPLDGHAFSNLPIKSTVFPIWNSTNTPREITFELLTTVPTEIPKSGTLAQVHLSRYDPNLSPIRLLHPWKAHFSVDAPSDGILETFRIYLPGYRARVDGEIRHTVPTENGLVGVALTAGNHEVEVYYRVPLKIRIAGLITLATCLGLAIAGVRRLRSNLAGIDSGSASL